MEALLTTLLISFTNFYNIHTINVSESEVNSLTSMYMFTYKTL